MAIVITPGRVHVLRVWMGPEGIERLRWHWQWFQLRLEVCSGIWRVHLGLWRVKSAFARGRHGLTYHCNSDVTGLGSEIEVYSICLPKRKSSCPGYILKHDVSIAKCPVFRTKAKRNRGLSSPFRIPAFGHLWTLQQAV